MSILAFQSMKQTSAKIKYLKETILIEDKAPTKIILKFIISFDENEYKALLDISNPIIAVKMPSSINIFEDLVEITQYKLLNNNIAVDGFKPKNYGYLTPKSADIAIKYIETLKRFETISDNWVGLHWKPRDDADDSAFYVPLYPSLKQVTRQDILIELPIERPPSTDGKCNVGLMLDFRTNNIPFKKGFMLETRVDIQNTREIDYGLLLRERIIDIEKGELWVLYPESSLVTFACPEPDEIFPVKKQDEESIQEYSKRLYDVGRWSYYKPRVESVPLKWDIDKHIKSWESNTLTFFSQALSVDAFWNSIRDSIINEVRFILKREFELSREETLREGLQFKPTSTESIETQLEEGKCYLLEEDDATKGYEVFIAYIKNRNAKGLCIIRGTPHPLLKEVKSEQIEIVYLDTTGSSDSISPLDYKAIVARVKEFLEKRETAIVFLDVLDYMFYLSDLNYLMNLLNRTIDIVRAYDSVLLTIASPIIFGKKISILEKNFELIGSS